MVIKYGFESPVKFEEQRVELRAEAVSVLSSVLATRTYFNQICAEKPFDDTYEGTDARMFLQAAFVCEEAGDYAEALAWYRAADILFVGTHNPTAVVSHRSDVHLLMVMDTEDGGGHWHVMVQGWVNTPFGSKQEDIVVGTVESTPLPTGQEFTDRLNELRVKWAARIGQVRKMNEELKNHWTTYDN